MCTDLYVCKVPLSSLLYSKLSHLFRTGTGIMMQYDEATPDGLQMVFTTNVAGHYIMVRQLGKSPAIILVDNVW